MSKSINDLPSELMIRILKRIDKRSLKNAALVCARWYDLIQTSCGPTITIDCLDRNFYGENTVGVNFSKRKNLKFNKIKIVDLVGETAKTVASILKRHARSIVRLTLFECYFHEFHVFSEMMNLLTNLEELILIRTKCFDIDHSSVNDTLKTMKLKSLQLINSDYCFFPCFKMLELNTIKIECILFQKTPVIELLRNQQQLKRLSLYSDAMIEFFDEAMPFQLTHFSMLNIGIINTTNLWTFLTTQTEIEALALERRNPGKFDVITRFQLDSILENFHSLKSLRLDMYDLPYLIGHQSIDNLILVNTTNVTSRSFTCNITEVTLENVWHNRGISLIASKFMNINKLSVRMFDIIEFDGIKFQNLKCLNIKRFNIRSLISWKEFIIDNSKITELTIGSYNESRSVDVNVFLKTTTEILKLRILRIGDINVDQRFFDIIRKNCSELKILDLLRSNSILGHSELNDIPGLQFHYDDFNFRLNDLESWYERMK